MVNREQVEFFRENGFLRLKQVYTPEEMAAMSEDMDYIIRTYADWNAAWRGPWRKEYLKEEEESKATLVAIHEIQHYSAAWARAIVNPRLADALAALLDSDAVEFHHSTLHAKPPDAGAPFPMHQDMPFYPHEDGRYLDTLVHLDPADELSGCIKFLAGSHKLGPLEHIMGPGISPHLPTDRYRLEDAVSVPAQPGDVVVFSIWTIHGSAVNHSGRWRRIVRVGYRDPHNRQVGGQALGRPGIIVKGVRPKVEGQEVDVYGNWNPGK
ncbi:MAG: phytanoyl-CoA dioxygenase family protein [Armatimonadetes bacterium]|nr:phytanoyl-CoA dioxygenase family protein [Armatimonadota bacterium]